MDNTVADKNSRENASFLSEFFLNMKPKCVISGRDLYLVFQGAKLIFRQD